MTTAESSQAGKEQYSFVCNAGCGVCAVKVAPFEYERTETLEGEHLDSKYQPQIVSSCCGAEVHVYDNHADAWGAEVVLDTPVVATTSTLSVPAAKALLVTALAEEKGWLRDYSLSLIEDAIERRHLEGDEAFNDASGTTWKGMRAAGWVWEKPLPSPLVGTARNYASHWSTGPKDAERLYRESDVRRVLSALSAHPVAAPSAAAGGPTDKEILKTINRAELAWANWRGAGSNASFVGNALRELFAAPPAAAPAKQAVFQRQADTTGKRWRDIDEREYNRVGTLYRRIVYLAAPEAPAVAAVAQPVALQAAHRLGFLRAAGWMQKDSLFSDVNTATYRKDRDHDLAALAASPSCEPLGLTDEEVARRTRCAFASTNQTPYTGLHMHWYEKGLREGAAIQPTEEKDRG
ncbi:hypothetical protein VLK31_34725 [Variovorax sp. H27-G14]|uniref:hypothetical protein n=1 Tax=Variovorax sp. H27-G14 TaxID=3111914 RepID=UPI0038FC16A8